MNACSGCNPCGNGCENNCKQASCLSWGFDGCYLRGRCPDGTELEPLNLCTWLDKYETCTVFSLVPDSENGGYLRYINECDNEERVYACDFLGLGNLECIGNVYNRTPAQSCDLLVFDPSCGDEGDPRYNKWSHYKIPDAGNCMMQPDENGYFKVLKKNDCGCIEECNLFAQSTTWDYMVRDSWPDDPDWPFTVGSYDEVIDLQLDQKIPMFGKADLEVTYQYGYGIQHQGHRPSKDMQCDEYKNFQSVVVPIKSGTPTAQPVAYNSIPVSATDLLQSASTNQGCNMCPWGSWEWQTSRTVVVPKGQRCLLHHRVHVQDWAGNTIPKGVTAANPGDDCSRLHQLRVFVRATKGVKL